MELFKWLGGKFLGLSPISFSSFFAFSIHASL